MQAILRHVALFLELVKFPHTIFALPFAFMGAILAARGVPSSEKLFWVLIAMVGARSGAMAFNRLADRKLDALNPRTKNRALPLGLISVTEASLFTLASFGLFLFAAWRLNPLCFKLAPLAVAFVTLYSYTKRFTTLSHLILGLADGIAPIGGWLAITGRLELPPFLLGFAVAFWVAGFDILYALADVDFDRQHGLYSYPAILGLENSLLISRAFHLVTILLLALLAPLLDLGALYGAGVALAAGLLALEHLLIERYGLGKLNAAFFTVNGIMSPTLFLLTLLDLLL